MSTIIMLGNPGAGKSTLLSSLVEGTHIFPSGIAIGRSKTTEIQQVEFCGNTYVDTPGLSDIQLREVAAHSIESAFKKGGIFQVNPSEHFFFV